MIQSSRKSSEGGTMGAGNSVRILFISHAEILGGAERSMLDLIAALGPRSYEPHVVVPAIGELSLELKRLNIPFHYCRHLARLRRAGSITYQIRQSAQVVAGAMALRSIVTAVSPDLIHANSTTAALYAVCLRGPNAVPPVVWHVRDLVAPTWVGRFLGNQCKKVVVTSSFGRSLVAGFVQDGQLITIPNGVFIPPEDAGSYDCNEPAGRTVVATIGQLVAWKGHQTAIDVATRVVDRCPHVDFLIIADDRFGGSASIADLHAAVDARGLAGRVTILPYQSDIGAVLSRTSILLHPAFPEPFGRIVVEAMVAGRPVVAWAGPHGPSEIVRDGFDGWLVPLGDVPQMANAVVSLARNRSLRQVMGQHGRERAKTHFDRRLMADRWHRLYRSIADGSAIGPQSSSTSQNH